MENNIFDRLIQIGQQFDIHFLQCMMNLLRILNQVVLFQEVKFVGLFVLLLVKIHGPRMPSVKRSEKKLNL